MIRLLGLLALAPAQAGEFELAFPVACVLNQTCFIQQYHDHYAGRRATDFTCGPLSYDGHDGTDIAVPTLAATADGVAMLAAAPRTILGTRDGMRDGPPDASVKDRECGNGVVIDHGAGWQTQYCHLRRGSVAVQKGDVMATGTTLGLIGQSGQAEFPHLHLAVRQDGNELDPFAPALTTCGSTGDDLWAEAPPYTPGGLIDAGFASEIPSFDAIKAGLPPPALSPVSPALVLWAHIFGGRAGDTVTLTIIGPNQTLIDERITLERTQARLFRAAGKRLTSATWLSGLYTGTATLHRGVTALGSRSISLLLAR